MSVRPSSTCWATQKASVETPGAIEAEVRQIVELGDHHVVVAEVTEAHLHKAPAGRPDEAILEMKHLGANVFYGG